MCGAGRLAELLRRFKPGVPEWQGLTGLYEGPSDPLATGNGPLAWGLGSFHVLGHVDRSARDL